MRGYTYNKISEEYLQKLFSDKDILLDNNKNIIAVWENFHIKPRKLFGLMKIPGQHSYTFIYELKNGNFLVKKPSYFKTYANLDKEFKELSEAIDYNNQLIDKKNKKIVRSELFGLFLILTGMYFYISLSTADFLWIYNLSKNR